jgi:DNA-binding NarL/FixJ family response regulator
LPSAAPEPSASAPADRAVVPAPEGTTGDAARYRPIRVVLADDSALVRETLELVLARAEGIEVMASCEERDSLMRAIDAVEPDVVITDIRMPPSGTDEGLQVAAALRRSHPHIGVVVLSQFADPGYGKAVFAGGVDGRAYLLKEHVARRGQLVSAIRAVAQGGAMVDPQIVRTLFEAHGPADHPEVAALSEAELEILTHAAQGEDAATIAEHLGLAKAAAQGQIDEILRKLGVAARTSADGRVPAVLRYLVGRDGA